MPFAAILMRAAAGDEHGFAGGYIVVKDYARLSCTTRSREVFVPLAHPPGHAQVDFGESVGVIGGVRMEVLERKRASLYRTHQPFFV